MERQNDFLALENKSVKLFQWDCPQTSSFTSGYITKRMKICLQKKKIRELMFKEGFSYLLQTENIPNIF